MKKAVTPRMLFVAVAVTALTGVSLGPAAQAVTDTEFRYSTAQRAYLMIPAAALVPSSNTSQYSLEGGFRIVTNAVAQVCFYAPVNLPHGVRVTAMRTWYLRPANPDVFFAILRRVSVPGVLTTEIVAGEQSTQLPVRTTYGVATTAINDGLEIIDNQRYAYYLQYCIANDWRFTPRASTTTTATPGTRPFAQSPRLNEQGTGVAIDRPLGRRSMVWTAGSEPLDFGLGRHDRRGEDTK